jgi:hypothetical protein
MTVRHAHQTVIANNPAKDVSATRWNEDHDLTDLWDDVAADHDAHDHTGVPGVGGGGPTVTGPFNVAFDTADFVDPPVAHGALVATIAADTLVRAWFHRVDAFDEAGEVYVFLTDAIDDASTVIFSGGLGGAGDGQGAFHYWAAELPGGDRPVEAVTHEACQVRVAFFSTTVPPTMGSIDVYVTTTPVTAP